jgi:LysR family transcriptional regulator for bpeEF and oprC
VARREGRYAGGVDARVGQVGRQRARLDRGREAEKDEDAHVRAHSIDAYLLNKSIKAEFIIHGERTIDHLFCIRVFARVVEQGSFTRAAEDLDIARPTATTAVARLEKRLKVRLLQRTTRRLSLTDEGRAFYQGCTRVLDDLAEAEDALAGAARSPRGRLRVSVPNSFIAQGFFAPLAEFLARNPELQLELVITDRAVNLVEEGIDCAVRAVPVAEDSTLVSRPISQVKWGTWASPAYLERHGEPRTLEELERHECLRFISPSTGRSVDWRFRRGGEDVVHVPRGSFGATSLEGVAAAAAAGVGIAQVSDALVVGMLRAGALEPVLLDFVAPGPSLCVVYPSSRYLTAKVRAFADFAASFFPRDGVWPEILALRLAKARG